MKEVNIFSVKIKVEFYFVVVAPFLSFEQISSYYFLFC
jgi:hypothetical protein